MNTLDWNRVGAKMNSVAQISHNLIAINVMELFAERAGSKTITMTIKSDTCNYLTPFYVQNSVVFGVHLFKIIAHIDIYLFDHEFI